LLFKKVQQRALDFFCAAVFLFSSNDGFGPCSCGNREVTIRFEFVAEIVTKEFYTLVRFVLAAGATNCRSVFVPAKRKAGSDHCAVQ